MNTNLPEQNGTFSTFDRHQTALNLTWFKTTMFSPELTHAFKEAWAFAEEAYVPVEMDFLKAFPEIINTEPYFARLKPFFNHETQEPDWAEAEKTMRTMLRELFVFDPSKINAQIINHYKNDQVFCVMAHDASTGKNIGFITFLIRSTYPQGSVKVTSLAVDPLYQARGIGKLLMSSIFAMHQPVNNLFLCTRPTNQKALNAYTSWGFTVDHTPILDHPFNLAHWTFMKSSAMDIDTLQHTATTLIA